MVVGTPSCGRKAFRPRLHAPAKPDRTLAMVEMLPRCLALVICLLGGVPADAQQATRPSLRPLVPSATKWLVDAARDYGLGVQGEATVADILIVQTLLRAATVLDPNASEPYRWLVDTHEELGETDEVREALERYVRHAEHRIADKLRWIGLSVAQRQTVEERERFIREQLEQAESQPLVAADLHRRLAEIALTQFEREDAKRHLVTALKRNPLDVAANRLVYQINTEADDPVERVRVALRLIRANPMQVTLVWQLARLLDDLSLHRRATPWYEYALAVHQAANPGKDPPAEFLFDFARSYADGRELQAALRVCSKAIEIRPGYVRARLLMVHILRNLRRNELALGQIRAIADHYAKLAEQVVETKDTQLATGMAWFYALYDARPDEAMRFAKIAVSGSDPSPEARRAYGFAALAKGDIEEAEAALKDLAQTDQMAAVGLARVYLKTKRAHRAVPLLQQAARIRASGVAYEEIVQLLRENGLSVPPQPDYTDVRRVLKAFDRGPLEYYKEPSRFLRLTARFVRPRFAPGEPWIVVFEMENTGDFAITIGEETMITAKLLCSITTSGDRTRQFANFLMVELDSTPVLKPGEKIRHVQTVDIGPVRRAMTKTPQRRHDIIIGGQLEPVRSPKGHWTHRLGGRTLPTARAERIAYDPGANGRNVTQLVEAMESGDATRILPAAAVLVSLLAEREAARAGELTYQPKTVDAGAILQSLLKTATKPDLDATVRARVIESLRRVPLSPDITKTLSRGLSDRPWLVRFVTAWLFAHKQGPAFSTVARRLAETDPDPLVRQLLRAYLMKWESKPPSPAKK